jgi:hypothetical protein
MRSDIVPGAIFPDYALRLVRLEKLATPFTNLGENMKKLRKLGAAVALTSLLGLSAFAIHDLKSRRLSPD